MSTGSGVIQQLVNVSVAPATGAGSNCEISFGGNQVLQACTNFYVEVTISDPTNTGAPATFEVQLVGGIQSTNNVIGTITSTGLATVTCSSPVTYWRADLISLSGGVAPKITVFGIAGQ